MLHIHGGDAGGSELSTFARNLPYEAYRPRLYSPGARNPPTPMDQVAALAVRSMPWTIRAALLMSGVQVLWLFLSLLAMWGSIASLQTVTAPGGTVYPASDCRDVASPHSCQCRGEVVSYNSYCRFEGRGGGFWVACFFLASLAWGSTVLQNVVAATINGSVASWWFCPEDRSPVRGALYRATRESFG